MDTMKNYLIPIALISLIVVGFLGVTAMLVSPEPVPIIEDSGSGCGSCGISSDGQSSGCGPGGGCGSGSTEEEARALAENYYYRETGDQDVEITIEDFGCHQEAEIIKDGQMVMKLRISSGEVSEI